MPEFELEKPTDKIPEFERVREPLIHEKKRGKRNKEEEMYDIAGDYAEKEAEKFFEKNKNIDYKDNYLRVFNDFKMKKIEELKTKNDQQIV